MAIFQPKMAQKRPLIAKIPNFLYIDPMPYEYPVNPIPYGGADLPPPPFAKSRIP